MQSSQFIGSLVQLHIDRPLGSHHPKHGFEYPINYGYLPDEIAPDGEPLDAYVLCVTTPLESFSGRCIAVIHRLNDDDDKLVVVPDGTELCDEDIRLATRFQEQFFESVILRIRNA
jgi:inorganic pyrophosphatase